MLLEKQAIDTSTSTSCMHPHYEEDLDD